MKKYKLFKGRMCKGGRMSVIHLKLTCNNTHLKRLGKTAQMSDSITQHDDLGEVSVPFLSLCVIQNSASIQKVQSVLGSTESSLTSFLLVFLQCHCHLTFSFSLSYRDLCAIIFFAYFQHFSLIISTYSFLIKFKCQPLLEDSLNLLCESHGSHTSLDVR